MSGRTLIRTLVLTATGLIVIHVANELLGWPSWYIEKWFELDRESNFPTWFSSFLLTIAAYFAYRCFLVQREGGNGRRLWLLFSFGLLGMSCDEVAMIHENLGNMVNKRFFNLQSIKHSEWVVLLGPLVLFIIFIFVRKLKNYLQGSTKAINFLTAGALIYIFGAFILESTINVIGNRGLLYKIEFILEESFEMFGVILIIKGLIEHHKFLLAGNRNTQYSIRK